MVRTSTKLPRTTSLLRWMTLTASVYPMNSTAGETVQASAKTRKRPTQRTVGSPTTRRAMISRGPMIRKAYWAVLGNPAVRPSPRSSTMPSIIVSVHTAATAPRKRHCGCFRRAAAR